MSEVVLTTPSLVDVARIGNHLVTLTTKYLSTLPHPIEPVEELIAVVAVTSSLLTSLHSAITRFPSVQLHPKSSFLFPLTHDILLAFKQLDDRVQEARKLKVFEPNNVGLVRLPRAAWCLVCGNEARAASLRSRMYVEKYRVRVLIEAVCWVGLRSMGSRSPELEAELTSLRNMLPLVTERLVGVQKDYVPRLRKMAGKEPLPEIVEEKKETPKPVQALKPTPVASEKETFVTAPGKLSRSSSTTSLASTCTASSTSSSFTAIDDSRLEIYVLRRNEAKKVLKKSSTLFGLPYAKQYTHELATYYIKPVPTCADEANALIRCTRNGLNDFETRAQIENEVLGLDDNAQWEIQKTIETREAACSSQSVKRNWEVVAFQERERRKISQPLHQPKTLWNRGGKNPAVLVEWVLVLRGETVDRKERAMPKKHEDPWKPVPAPAKPIVEVKMEVVVAAPRLPPHQPQPQQILRHVKNRKPMTVEEAETKMGEIVKELFIQKDAQE